MFNGKLHILLIPAVFWVLSINAQNTPHKLDSTLQKRLNDQRTSLNVKGLSAAIHFSDGNVWAGTSGISATNQPLDSTYAFGIGSITKTVTSAAILQLADEQLLHLDDSLHEWVDTFSFINPNITIRQLLRHQSGIYDVVTDPNFQDVLYQHQDSIWQLGDVVKTFIKAPYFQPGASWRYSNTNYILLGMIIEKATGMPYYEVFRERFMDNFNLTSFAMEPFETSPNPIAHPWLDLTGDGIVDDAYQVLSNWESFDAATGPAGSYYATPTDLSLWIWKMMRGELVSSNIWQQAVTTVSTTFQGNTRYGLGLMERTFVGRQAYGHGGDSGYSGSAWYFPSLDISIVVLNNDARKNSWEIMNTVQALLQVYLNYLATSGTSELVDLQDVRIAPNPFTDQINLSVFLKKPVNNLTLQLYDTQGKLVHTQESGQQPAGEARLHLRDLGTLPKGLYCLNAYAEGQLVVSERVVRN